MTEIVTRTAWLRLYKNLFTCALKFQNYNYREYAKRRIRDYFRSDRAEKDPAKLRASYEFGQREFLSLKRQIALDKLYAAPKLVIENLAATERIAGELEKTIPVSKIHPPKDFNY